MKYFKLLTQALLYAFIIVLGLTLIITIFSYFNLFNDSTTKIFKLLSIVISVFVSGFIVGKNGLKKGYIEGSKLSVLVISILTIFTLIFKNIKIYTMLYYVIIIISTVFGSMIGSLKKTKK